MKAFWFAILVTGTAIAAALPASAQDRAGREASNQKMGEKQAAPQGALKPLNEKQFPQNVSWAAVSLNGRSFPGEPPSMMLDAQYRLKGFSGCNTFSATAYPLREQRLAVGPFALTRKSCAGPTMASEKSFLTALRTSAQWDLVGPNLVIKTQAGELRFERSL